MPQPLEDQRTTVYRVDPEHPANPTLPTLRTEEMMLNMGPQHPSTHGVLKIVLSLEGERIVKATPVMGFLHRGVEKLAEDGTYHQFIPHTDRLDYVCAMYNNFAYCRAVEKLMNLKVPERAEYLRTIVAEVQRIIGHQFWLGTQALDIGAMTVFFYTFRDREILLDWFDELCGARLTTSWYRIGGVERDFTPSLVGKIRLFLDYFPPKIDEYVVFLEKNRIWLSRTQGVAVISAEDAVNFGLSGPTLRGSGVDYDLRKYESYGAYPKCVSAMALLAEEGAPAFKTSVSSGLRTGTPCAAASTSFSRRTVGSSKRFANSAPSTTHGKFVVLERFATTGPATPKQAASIRVGSSVEGETDG